MQLGVTLRLGTHGQERGDGIGAERELLTGWHEVPSKPEHVFNEQVNAVAAAAGLLRESRHIPRRPRSAGVRSPAHEPTFSGNVTHAFSRLRLVQEVSIGAVGADLVGARS